MIDVIEVPLKKSYKLVNHGPVVVITTFDGQKHNAAPIAWLIPVDFEPPLFAAVISRDHKTHENLVKTGSCVINVVTEHQAALVKELGSVSGHEVDKMTRIDSFPSKTVKPVSLSGCVAWIEAKLVKVLSDEYDMLLLEATRSSARAGSLTDNFEYKIAQYPTLHHLGSRTFGVCDRTV